MGKRKTAQYFKKYLREYKDTISKALKKYKKVLIKKFSTLPLNPEEIEGLKEDVDIIIEEMLLRKLSPKEIVKEAEKEYLITKERIERGIAELDELEKNRRG